ncbi:membrane protein insertase YidC [Candidatus Saccharibacteria bacterium]|nr:membrane protein insertase YidC [Candidatus Saccharibacteria bacterium]
MLTTLIVQPIFNLLVLVYALLPGHNLGLAIILFTIVIRLLLWPLLRKQLHNAKAMRKLQPELKRIKQESKGDRQRESMLVMELYKECGVNPFSSIGILLLQLPVLIGLYAGLQRIISDPNNIVNFAYPVLQNLGWMKELAVDISKFDQTLFGFIDLTRPALSAQGTYWPAMALVIGSSVTQYYQSKQLMPNDKDGRKLRHILRDAGSGAQADQSEINAAVGRSTRYFIPVLIFFFTVNIASALGLYWLISGLVAMIQQHRILKDDEEEIETKLHKKDKKSTARVVSNVIEGEVVEKPKKATSKKSGPKSKKAKKRRR